MNLSVRERNRLRASAGLPPAYPERDLDEEEMRPFRIAVEAIQHHHEPFPACAIDGLGRVQMTNAGFRAVWPRAEHATPVESVDAFFGSGQEEAPMAATSSCLVSPRSPARSRCCLTSTRIS